MFSRNFCTLSRSKRDKSSLTMDRLNDKKVSIDETLKMLKEKYGETKLNHMLADLAVSDGLKNWSSPRSKMLLVKKTLIQDAVHGPIRVDPRLFCIIDTPEFQRMRWIHQLGPIFLVYPTACHKRFSHSIGTYHVAKTLLENIYRQQRPQNLTRRIIFLVSTAALVHDIGHGPFSHAFEHVLRGLFSGKEVPDHEKMGANILDFM